MTTDPLRTGGAPSSGTQAALAVIRANLRSPTAADLVHLKALAEALAAAPGVGGVVLALPDDPANRKAAPADFPGQAFFGDASDMNVRLLEVLRAFAPATVLDCSLLTQCLEPAVYGRLLAFHLASPLDVTFPHLWYPEYLPKVVRAARLAELAEDRPWPYYAPLTLGDVNRFVPDVDAAARALSGMEALCQDLVYEKARAARRNLHLAVHPFDPANWISRCRILLGDIDRLFHRRDIAVLEVGCGRRFGLGLLLHLAGVARYAGIDIRLNRLTVEQVGCFRDLLEMWRDKLDIPGLELRPVELDGGGDFDVFFDGAVELRGMNGAAMEYPDAAFDLIFSDAVLEHVSDCRAVIAEMHRVLKPGGCALHIIDFGDHATPGGGSQLLMSKESWRASHPPLINLMGPQAFYALFREAGFEILELQETKRTNVDPADIHPDYLADGLSEALTHSSRLLVRKKA